MKTFQAGDYVAVKFEGKFFKAKIFSVRDHTKKYFVHYLGWSKKFDEWVEVSRIKVYDESLEKVKAAKVKADIVKRKEVLEKGLTDKEKAYVAERVKRRKVSEVDGKSSASETEVEIDIPKSLKVQLFKDYERISKDKKVVPVPREDNKTVEAIFVDFIKHQRQSQPQSPDRDQLLAEFVDGLREYFNGSLPRILLYRNERPQLQFLKVKHLKMTGDYSKFYGAEHLLRLFVKLPELLAYTTIDEEALSILTIKILEFLEWLADNSEKYFAPEYVDASSVEKIK